jgi:hypothetical protein
LFAGLTALVPDHRPCFDVPAMPRQVDRAELRSLAGRKPVYARAAWFAVQWLVLLSSGFSLILPVELQTVCDPAQCVREAQRELHLDSQSDSQAAEPSEEAPVDGDCGSPFHLCHCCAHVQVLSQRHSLRIGEPRFAGLQPKAAAADLALTGYRARLFRPPSAV